MDWFREHAWETWTGLAILLGVLELFSLDLVLLMLAGGALVGVLTALLGLPVAVQILAASASAVAMLAFVRPSIVKRLHDGPELRHGAAALIGQQGFVVEQVSQHDGRIKIGGEIWSAKPYDDSLVIPVGAKVEVFEIRGATAFVHQVAELEPGPGH